MRAEWSLVAWICVLDLFGTKPILEGDMLKCISSVIGRSGGIVGVMYQRYVGYIKVFTPAAWGPSHRSTTDVFTHLGLTASGLLALLDMGLPETQVDTEMADFTIHTDWCSSAGSQARYRLFQGYYMSESWCLARGYWDNQILRHLNGHVISCIIVTACIIGCSIIMEPKPPTTQAC